ncbi:MAG: hypothetical protein H6934_13205 [Burkholderiaceae bacterium]|nr:hypothetical protein [Burkholderiaceae bacterium]
MALAAIPVLVDTLALVQAAPPADGGQGGYGPQAVKDVRPIWSEAERRRILKHGPWPPVNIPDLGNRAAGRHAARRLGAELFFDPVLSANGRVSCASCHHPGRDWSDGQARPLARDGRPLDRNTPSLWNVGQHRWLGWDGGSDSLWAFVMRPLMDSREMGARPEDLKRLMTDDPRRRCLYRASIDEDPATSSPEAVARGVAKVLAAFVGTLISPRTSFDAYRDALARGGDAAGVDYPVAAQRGLRIFVGQGRCHLCHSGPMFSHGEFHDIGRPHRRADGRVDPGRHAGIARVRSDRNNRAGPHSDDRAGAARAAVGFLRSSHRNWGAFRVPGLRQVAGTAPYFHDGSAAGLADVIAHYDLPDAERLHTEGEALIAALNLTPGQRDDLEAFLRTLSAPTNAQASTIRLENQAIDAICPSAGPN